MINRLRMTTIISICRPNKLGLIDLAKSLVRYGNELDKQRKYLLLMTFAEFFCILIKARKSKEKVICIFWDNSLYSLSYLILSRLFFFKTIYYYHEPGGYAHKRRLRATIAYSFFSSFAECVYLSISNFIGISRKDKISSGDYFLPLLYDDIRPLHIKGTKKIGYLGNLKKERLPNVLKEIEPLLNAKGYEVVYFPSIRYGQSTFDKYAFLSQCTAVWNVYAYPYNLSGVTGDAFMSNTPLIVSEFEPFLDILNTNNLAILFDRSEPNEVMVEKIEKSIKIIDDSPPSKSLTSDQSRFGGKIAFLDYWKRCFDEIDNK